MQAVERAVWTPHQQALWVRIESHPFERPDQALDFTRRLARDRGWNVDFARVAVREYRRFCFLAMISDRPVTPSEEVDEVWHQHLTHSRDYWDAWCGEVLCAELHHDPTSGGPAEGARYRVQYAETLALYEAHFGPIDPNFWPATHRRFRGIPRYRMVDADRVFILPRPKWPFQSSGLRAALPIALLGLVLASSSAIAVPLNPLDWTAEPFLTLYVTLAVAALIFALVQDRRLRGSARRAVPKDLGIVELAWLADGRARAANTVILGFLDAKAARIRSTSRPEYEVHDRGVALAPSIEPFRGVVGGEVSHKAFVAALGPRLDRVEEGLAKRGLVPSREMLTRMRHLVLFVFGSVIALGVAKAVVGLWRDKPIGFLSLLILFTLVFALLFLWKQPGRTSLGDDTLAYVRQHNRRAATSPRESELLFAFALTGASVLAGTHLAEFQRLQQSSGGGSDGTSGGDGGSGGGGSGCGGCGGGGD